MAESPAHGLARLGNELVGQARQYAQLMRLDKPVGIWLLLWPTLWGLWIAGSGRPEPVNFLVFVAGVIVMRSAGCVINDFADRHIDGAVERTRSRPLAAGLVTPNTGTIPRALSDQRIYLGKPSTMGGTDVDEDATVVLRHSSGVLSTIRCSLRTRLGNDLVIEGTSGVIRVAAPIYRPFRATIETFSPTARASGRGSKFERQRESSLVQGLMQRTGGMLMARRGGTSLSGYYQGNGYIHQAEEARRCIEAGLIESPVAPHARSTEIMQLITQAQRTFSSARGKS